MANLCSIAKTVTSAGTPELLGVVKQRFRSIMFFGGKGTAETANTGTVYVQLRQVNADGTPGDWLSAIEVKRGTWSAALHDEKYFDASQFRVKVLNDGDGIVAAIGG